MKSNWERAAAVEDGARGADDEAGAGAGANRDAAEDKTATHSF